MKALLVYLAKCTWPSTLARIKEESKTQGPKGTIEKVSTEVRGVLSASEPGEPPRNEKQVNNLRQNARSSVIVPGTCIDAAADELFTVMQNAQTKDRSHQFVCNIKTSPEPAIVLADDQQLQDLVRFGTSSFEFCIITVDPTFSLGEFDVSPLSYRNLLFETKRNSQPPIFLGPILIHYKKTFTT